MNLILIILTTIDLLLAFLALSIGIAMIKRQDKLRYHYFLFKKRARILRQFKELYYSYELYRLGPTQNSFLFLKEEKFKQLLRNNFLGKDLSFYDEINKEENVLKLQEKLRDLDNLADDFKVLYDEKKTLPVQNFIFWYRLLVRDFGMYKKNLIEGEIGTLENNMVLENHIKKIESCYGQLNDLSLFSHLESGVKIVKL
jgi:hypothetical protein